MQLAEMYLRGKKVFLETQCGNCYICSDQLIKAIIGVCSYSRRANHAERTWIVLSLSK